MVTSYFLDYNDGSRSAAALSWNGRVDEFDEFCLARHVVNSLNTEVMFEPNNIKLPDSLDYVFIDCSGNTYAADYIDLDDGVDVLPESLVSL